MSNIDKILKIAMKVWKYLQNKIEEKHEDEIRLFLFESLKYSNEEFLDVLISCALDGKKEPKIIPYDRQWFFVDDEENKREKNRENLKNDFLRKLENLIEFSERPLCNDIQEIGEKLKYSKETIVKVFKEDKFTDFFLSYFKRMEK